MTSTQQLSTLAAASCEVAFDNLTRQLYATDASIYQIEPVAVAFPKATKQAIAIVEAASQAGIAIIPRGAGTGLAGGAIGDGLVIDFSRYNRHISDLDVEQRHVRVGAGVVLDQLNQFLRPHGLCFGPDVATSSRATIGGMIANNSSGAHAPVYGTTADHLVELEIVLSGGRFVKIGPKHEALPRQRETVEDAVLLNGLRIAERFPSGLRKRWPGYALDRCLREPGNLNHVLCGSEGTLAAITSATVKLVRMPKEKGLALLFFHSVAEAMQATVELLDLKPAAIEHIDRVLLDQTKGNRDFQAARDLLNLDSAPCQSILVVEFFDQVPERLAALERRRLGSRRKVVQTESGANLVWALRKAGLSLLTGRKGDAKPVAGIEDVALRPERLPDYVSELQSLMRRLDLQASYYGHAAGGLLHVRPILNLHSAADLKRLRQVAEEVSALVQQFNGSISAEHGVGIARTEFLLEQLGEDLMSVMRQIKTSFDPHNLFNPGKIVPDGRFRIDTDLRTNFARELKLPFEPVLAFAAKDESFIRNLEQCNGCGGCRKETPTMCPTFMATGQEVMSTRGRANAIRTALEMRGISKGDPLRCNEVEVALSNCLSCKACTNECPSNVNMALLKAEMLHGRIQRHGLTLRQRVFSSIDRLGRLGCSMPILANFILNRFPSRFIMTRLLGMTSERALPQFTRRRFDRWFAKRMPSGSGQRGRVILWDDTFVRYYEPQIGRAAVKVLEAAGFEVALLQGRQCCGRPAFSQGNLDEAAKLGRHNLELLRLDENNAPILFLEPSCYSMFAEDYRELNLPDAAMIAERCYLFEEFIEDLLGRKPGALKFGGKATKVIIHAHCHAKATMNVAFMRKLAQRLPNRNVNLLDSGCCGMAGAFGALESKYELSLKVAEPLIQQVRSQPFGTIVVASGSSCRQQIHHLAPVRVKHMAELLADALV